MRKLQKSEMKSIKGLNIRVFHCNTKSIITNSSIVCFSTLTMKTQKVLLPFMFLLFPFLTIAQQVEPNQNIDIFSIHFINAITGDPVSGAKVMIENLGSYKTDSSGTITFPKQPNGSIKAIFRKDGFISAIYNIDIASETIFRNRFIVSPTMEAEQFRIVLSWDKQPEDLDAHFLETRSYHISFRNTRVLNDGSGQLDRDDMDGYGPESITVSQIDPESEYHFFVYKYTSKKKPSAYPLSSSKATVWVYGNNRLLNVIQIPSNIKGDTWNVFKLINGEVVENNESTTNYKHQ